MKLYESVEGSMKLYESVEGSMKLYESVNVKYVSSNVLSV